jgi:hypothetical protein
MGFSKKMMGKEVGQAPTYAKPHTMKGKGLTVNQLEGSRNKAVDPNTMSADKVGPRTPAMRVSLGNPNANDIKTSGIKIRGTGAATKGTMARGPMG